MSSNGTSRLKSALKWILAGAMGFLLAILMGAGPFDIRDRQYDVIECLNVDRHAKDPI